MKSYCLYIYITIYIIIIYIRKTKRGYLTCNNRFSSSLQSLKIFYLFLKESVRARISNYKTAFTAGTAFEIPSWLDGTDVTRRNPVTLSYLRITIFFVNAKLYTRDIKLLRLHAIYVYICIRYTYSFFYIY